ncbi:transglutaminase domain-containing protein [Streptococcus pseudoporcinus]|uniref:Ribonucleases G and E n=1 Tax=Streptococcus pseudoporcinus TaxID=361101 RepID=A0A4U9XHH3_9STRE|nr:transglutaminase domain-containing protein [Streptococcus pseudoporcinus]VTS12419.1 ribonucleases G and E [Streptococcus pseudoporcinus]VUC64946.1 ribonucleases G and E [Streptococcus pseudoporcinus]VUC95538.1 ribonucleases G and E [Streptococcus pseudoporcinus]VUC95933.1 ribonucleases G and E [Streptococcus pseudoporcinus]
MKPIKHYSKSLLMLSLLASTSTLALLSLGLSQPVVLARENENVRQLQSENKQIKTVDFQEFSKKLKEEITEDRQFHVFKLGLGVIRNAVRIGDLSELSKHHDFIMVNNRASHNKYGVPHIIVMNKDDVIVHNQEDYNKQMAELTFAGDKPIQSDSYLPQKQRIHALFKIELDSNRRQLLNAAGLKTPENNVTELDTFTIYSHGLAVDNKFYDEYSHFNNNTNVNITKQRFTENDDLIHNLITTSKAKDQPTDRDKVKTFVMYVANHTTYDWSAANNAVSNISDVNYYLGSDLFSVTKGKKAMCVGFSTTAARAFNMLGIPAYVVEGKNAQGVVHATARAYYDGKWHTIDGTGFINGSRSPLYSENHFNSIGEDSYQLVGINEDTPFDRNYMKIDKVYEEWAPKQKTADLLLVNKDKSLVGLDCVVYVAPVYVDKNSQDSLTQIYKKLKETMESSSKKNPSSVGFSSLLGSASSDIAKLNGSSPLTQEEYDKIHRSMTSILTFFAQLDKDAAEAFEKGNDYQNYLAKTKNAQ